MQIGDKVLIRGTVDEIRKDVVIIKNEGGYFGTVPSEIIAELPKGHGRLIDADEFLERVKKDREHEIYLHSWTADMVLERLDSWYAPTVEAISKDNVYKAIQEMMKYEHEGFINISLARLDEILKKCGVVEDGNGN